MFSWRKLPRRPVMIAHRGSSAVAPENTLAAFRQAVEDGADAIELDARLTRDGHVVVFHDSRLQRTTNGRGRVRDMTLTELRKLSAGGWFDRRFEGEKIPLLDEVFDVVPPTMGINIELKTDRRHRLGHGLFALCCRIVKRRHAEARVLLSSFNYRQLKRVKGLGKEFVTGVLFHPVRPLVKSPVKVVRRLGSEYLLINGSRLRKRFIENAHEEGLYVGEYTVNTTRRMERVLRYRLDVFFTDNPRSMRNFLPRK